MSEARNYLEQAYRIDQRSIEILVDTREQPTKRAMKRYERFGCPHRRCTLSYGDYSSYNATLPDGSSLYDAEETVSPGFR